MKEITREVFSYPERIERGGISCPYEHWMVHVLRERDGIPELSLVAELGFGRIQLSVPHPMCFTF
ncbi:MAG: hypothetical protein K1W23_05760 [Lachnospiraceae bacterium]